MKSRKFNQTFKNLFLSAAACLVSASTIAATTLKMGAVLPMSGDQATFGEETVSGMRLAIEEINKAKGPVKIDLLLEDEKSAPTDAANAAQKLIKINKVHVLVGSVASTNTLAMTSIAQAAKVPLITPASTNVKVTEAGDYISRICFIDDFQGLAMAKFAFESGKKTAAVIIDKSSAYSEGLAKAFIDTFTKLGGKVVVEASYSQKERDFSSQLTKVRLKKPEVVFVPGYYTEVGNMIRQARNQKISAVFLGGDGWSSPELYKLAGDSIVNQFYADHFSDEDTDPKVQEFVKKYKAKFGQPPGAMAALGYDSVLVVADAIKRNGNKVDPEGLKKAINATKNLAGVTGSITLDANRNASKPLVILQTQKDRASFYKRVNP